MAGSVGQVYYDVLPNLDGFAEKVASGLRNTKPVKVNVQADTRQAETSARNLTRIQQREAERASRQKMALIQRDAIAENRYRDRAAAQAIAATQRQAREEARARQVAARAFVRDTAARRQALQSVGSGLAVGGLATAAVLGGISKVTADFDKAVSNVASTGKEAQASIAELRAEAVKYGADTAFSATEAANAQAELIKANVSVSDTINGGLKGALDLAAAGSLGVADAAGIMGTAMSQFNIDGTQASHVADLFAAGAGKAQGEVQDFAEALKYVGPIANSAGVSIEETTGVIAELANQGILGSQAGTSLRGILLALTAPAGAGAKAMKEYGINVRDASGQFIGFEGAAAELQKRLGGLGQAERDAALARIFGRNSITAATILYEGGAEGVRQWTDAVNESGYASDVARTKMDNLSGDLEQLRGALDSAFIQAGGGGTEFFRDLAQGATGVIDDFNSLSPAVQEGSFKLAAFVAAGALASGALIKIVGAGTSAIATLTTLGVVGPTAAAGLTKVGAAGVAAGAGLAAVAAGNIALDQLGAQTKPLSELEKSLGEIAAGGGDLNSVFSGSNFFDELQGSLTTGIAPARDLASALKGLEISQDTLPGKFSRFRESITLGNQSIEQAEEQVSALDQALANMVNSGKADQAAAAVERLGINGEQSRRFLTGYTAALNEQGEKAASSFRSSEIAFKNGAAGTRQVGEAAQFSAEELGEMASALYDTANAALAMSGSQIGVEAAIDAASASFKENGKNLDINTAKGRANQTALDSLATATLNATQAMYENGESASSIVAVNERAKESWIKNAVAMGRQRGEAEDLADSLFQVPTEIQSEVVVKGAKVSKEQAKDLNAALKGIPKEQRARIVTIAQTKGAKEAQREIAKVKNKSVIAKATGKGVDTVKEIDAAIKKLKSKEVRANAKAAGKGAVDALDKAIDQLKSKRVTVTGVATGESQMGSLRSAINRVQGKTVFVRVKKEELADGGYVAPVSRAGGGPIRGTGGPRQDNIAGIDRATGVQTSWVSAKEFVVNAAQTAANYAQIETINRGGKWDLVPRRASGGSISSDPLLTTSGGGRRSLTLNLDMGQLFGGVQQLVVDLMDDRDEYSASVGRMQ